MKWRVPTSLALAGGLLLAGCAASGNPDAAGESPSAAAPAASPSAMVQESPSADEATEAGAAEGAWIDQAAYEADPATYHADGDVVLFFSATWCPTCQASIKALDRDGVPPGLTVVRVDYDSQRDLKRQHGVTIQHTYVQVDEAGNTLTKWTGSLTGEQIAARTV